MAIWEQSKGNAALCSFLKLQWWSIKLKKKHSVSCCCSKVAAMWCIRLARGWHFNICLLSGEQQQRRTLLILISASVTLLRGGGIYISSCVNEHKLTAGVCVCYLSPEKWSFLSNCSISHTSYPSAFICLTGTLMILKSACSYNASYIDRLISVFMRSLQKMVREHLSPQQANPGVTETSTGT